MRMLRGVWHVSHLPVVHHLHVDPQEDLVACTMVRVHIVEVGNSVASHSLLLLLLPPTQHSDVQPCSLVQSSSRHCTRTHARTHARTDRCTLGRFLTRMLNLSHWFQRGWEEAVVTSPVLTAGSSSSPPWYMPTSTYSMLYWSYRHTATQGSHPSTPLLPSSPSPLLLSPASPS